jgi:hypothetical protein
MIGHTHEVHRGLDLDVIAHWVLDSLALRVLQCIVRARKSVAHEPGIHGPTGVDVFLAEVGIAIGILLDTLLGLCRSSSAGLLCLLWGLGFLTRNKNADAE